MTERREDKAFEDFLEGRSPLSERYAMLKDVEPPAEIDRRILAEARAEARDAARAKPRNKGSWWRPWPALATVVVAGVAVMLSLDLLRTQSFEIAPAQMRSQQQTGPAAYRPAEGESDEAKAGAIEGPDAAAADEGLMLSGEAAPGQEPSQYAATRETSTPDVRAARDREDRLALASSAQDDPDRDETEGSGAAARVTADAPLSEAVGKTDADDLTESRSPERVASPALKIAMVGEEERRMPVEKALAIATSRLDERRRQEASASTSADADSNRMAVSMSAPQAEAERAPAARLEEDPALWLELVDVLVEQGREDLAAEQMLAFRKAFPDRALAPRHEALLDE